VLPGTQAPASTNALRLHSASPTAGYCNRIDCRAERAPVHPACRLGWLLQACNVALDTSGTETTVREQKYLTEWLVAGSKQLGIRGKRLSRIT
jgi:hypothetical protein